MIRFEARPAPEGFSGRVAQRGTAWLAASETGRLPPYWQEFRHALADAFGSLCAYGAMYEPVGTVDHFVSVNEDRSKAYDWSNYRFASAWLNSSKQALRSSQLIDPFTVQDGWFEVQLPSMQLALTEHVPAEWRERGQFMLERMHLAHDERIVRQRREWFRMYQEGGLSLDELAKKAPLIAAAIAKRAGRSLQVT
jgi:hypothetical protein